MKSLTTETLLPSMTMAQPKIAQKMMMPIMLVLAIALMMLSGTMASSVSEMLFIAVAS